jgi:predicted ester cyclase
MMDYNPIANEHKVLSLVQHFYQTIDAQQWDNQGNLVSNDFVAILGGTIRIGFETWQQKLKGFYTGFPDGQHHLDFYLVEGARILSVGRFVGTHQEEFMGQRATENHINMGVMHLDRVVDNKIVEHIAGADLLGLLKQIESKT